MSRGLGTTQRAILGVLGDTPLSVYELAELIYGRHALSPPERARRESVRRALSTLSRQGLVKLGYGIGSATEIDPAYTTRQHLVAWLPERPSERH